MAAELGHDKDAAFFGKRAEKAKQSINEKLLNPDTGLYVDGEGSLHSSLHANMFAPAFHVVPEDRKTLPE